MNGMTVIRVNPQALAARNLSTSPARPVTTRPITPMSTAVAPNAGAALSTGPIRIPQVDRSFRNNADATSANQNYIPNAITVTVSSAAGMGAANTDVNLFNTDVFGNQVTDNGSGAGSVTYAYQDKTTTGGVLSRMLAAARAGVGAVMEAVSMRAVLIAGGGNPAALGAMNAAWVSVNGYGRPIPTDLNMTSDQTRADQDFSIQNVPISFNFLRTSQFQFTAIPGNTYTLTFYTGTNYKL